MDLIESKSKTEAAKENFRWSKEIDDAVVKPE